MKIIPFHCIGLILLFSGVQLHATIYAAAKLTKDGKTVYLLSDIEGESDVSPVQRCAILAKACYSDTVLIARDPSDIRRVIDSIPQEHRACFQKQQAGVEEVADQFNAVRRGILTLAYRYNLGVANMNYGTVVFNRSLPFESVKKILNDVISVLKDQLLKLSEAECEDFWQHVEAMNTLNDRPTNIDEVNKLNYLVMRIEQLSALNGVRLVYDLQRDAMVCSTPEDIAYVAERLSQDGWQGDISDIINFNRLVSSALDAQATERVKAKEPMASGHAKLQASLKKVKKTSQKELIDAFNKRWANAFEFSPIAQKNETALKYSGPVDLTAFLANESQPVTTASETASSSNVQTQETSFNMNASVSDDAFARMKHAINIQQQTDFDVMQAEEKNAIARKVCNDLLPIFELNNETFIDAYEHELVYMQIHASEIMAYFYAQAGDDRRECLSLVNALMAAHNNNLAIAISDVMQFPWHVPQTVQRLAHLVKTPEHKAYVAQWLQATGFDEHEQANFFAELDRFASIYN